MRVNSIGQVRSNSASFKGIEKKDDPQLANIAINGGGGRIGKNALRQYALAKHAPQGVCSSWDVFSDIYKNLNIVAINMGSMGLKGGKTIQDVAPSDLESILTVDSVLGKMPDAIKFSVSRDEENTYLNISSRRGGEEKIKLLATRDNINFSELGADIVMETSGSKKDVDEAAKFNDASGTKYTVVSAPVKDALTVVAGVNNERIDEIDEAKNRNVISAASCTTTCISPIIKLMNDTFGVESGFIETTHAVTATQFTADKTKSKADSKNRNSFDSMIPTTTGAAKAVGLVLPELNGKLDGEATRVPVTNGSMAIMVLNLKNPTDVKTVQKVLKEAEQSPEYKNLIVQAPFGSSSRDILNRHESAMYVPESIKVINGNQLVIKAYYDNEFGYTRSLSTLTSKLGDKVVAEKMEKAGTLPNGSTTVEYFGDPIDEIDPEYEAYMRSRSGEDLDFEDGSTAIKKPLTESKKAFIPAENEEYGDPIDEVNPAYEAYMRDRSGEDLA